MKLSLKFLVPVLLCLSVMSAWAELTMGQAPKAVTLEDKVGGHLDGTPWSSSAIEGKVSVIFYVDPDEKDLNNDATEALKDANFSLEKYQSFAIINMAATWLPNFAISSSLEKKQKQYPNTIYVRDYEKVLVKEWGLTDDTNDVLAFDTAGSLIFRKDGKLSEEEIQTLLKAVEDAINN